MNKTEIKNILDNWLNDAKKNIIKNYHEKNMKASGNFEKMLRVETKESAIDVTGKMYAPFYYWYMEYGRGATKTAKAGNPRLFDVIKKWIFDKNIIPTKRSEKETDQQAYNSLAWAITKKIHKIGTRPFYTKTPTKVFTSVINKNSVDELLKTLGIGLVNSVKADILNKK